jgi:hypothetical protein
MQERTKPATQVDFGFLDEATRSLLGYFVHTWYRHYLAVITNNLNRYHELGLIEDVATPTETGRYSMLFDFTALDLEKLCYINGIYFYILSAHKSANYRLMNKFEGKQVLYLRGYDYEGSVSVGGGVAAGFSSTDTQQFNWLLGEHLAAHCQLFKVMSPKDVYWETVSAQRHFYGDYDGVIAHSRHKFVSVYLNALRWQEGVLDLLDGMDHYIVYVSSITESLLWELSQLDTDERRQRVTVVFDEKAIQNKEMQLGLRDKMRAQYGDKLIWAKPGASPGETSDELRRELSRKFTLVTRDEFESKLDNLRHRISESASALPPGSRETRLDFRYHPAMEEASLTILRDTSAWVEARIAEWSGDRGIDCLPLFLNLVQLRVFMTLLLGEHRETGRALAAYAGIMQSAQDHFTAPGMLSEDGRERNLDLLSQHLGLARKLGWFMMSSGRSHEFGDYRVAARVDFDAAFDRTKSAADHFFATAAARNSGHVSLIPRSP